MALRPIFYDTETTGLSPEADRIIEIAAYDPHNQKTFCSFVNPGRPIPAEATAISHITNDMVKDAASFAEVSKEFVAFCTGDTVLIAHNNDSFDVHFLRNEFRRNDLEMPSWQFLDTVKWARRYRPDLPRHSLQFLREIYGIAANNAHRALDDVMVLAEVFYAMVDDLPIEKVMELIRKQEIIRQMPFGKHKGVPLEKLSQDYIAWLAESGALAKPENKALHEAFVQLSLLR